MSESQLEELSSQKDNVGLIRAAFLLYIRKNLVSLNIQLDKYLVIQHCLLDHVLKILLYCTFFDILLFKKNFIKKSK